MLNPGNTVAGSDGLATGPWDKYLKTAAYFAFEMKPRLAITHGFSGSGKSTLAMNRIDVTGGIRIRSDVERHRLAEQVRSIDKYSARMSDRVYDLLRDLAVAVVQAGFSVIVDATFLKGDQRQAFRHAADRMNLGLEIIDCQAPFDELCQRILERGSDPSEATVDILKKQMEIHDPLTREERTLVSPTYQ